MDEQNISQECMDELNMTDSFSMGGSPDVFYGSPIAGTSTYPEPTRTRYRPGNIMDSLATFQRLQRMRRQVEMNRTPPAMFSPQRPSPRAVVQQVLQPSPGPVISPGPPLMPAASTPRKQLPLTAADINLSHDLLCPFEFAPHEPERLDLLLGDIPDTLPQPLITAPVPRNFFKLLEYVQPSEEPGQDLTDVSMEFADESRSMGLEELEEYIREEATRGVAVYAHDEDEEQKLYALGRNWSAIECGLEDEEAELSGEAPSYLTVSSLTPQPEVFEASLGAESSLGVESFPSGSFRDSTYSTLDSAGQLFVEDENEPGTYAMPKITRIRDPAERFRILKYLKDRYFGDLTQSSVGDSSFMIKHIPEIPEARRSFGGWRQPREEFPRRLSAPPALYRRRESSIDPGMLTDMSLDLMDASMVHTPPRTPEIDMSNLMEESMPLEAPVPDTPVYHFPGIIEPQDAFSPRGEEEFRNATRRFFEVKYNDQMYYPSHMPDLPDLADITPPFVEPGRRRLDFSGESDILGSTFLDDECLMDITGTEGRDSTFSTIPSSVSAGDLFLEDENEPGRYTMPLVTQIQDPAERFKRLKFLKDRILANLTESSADSSFLIRHVPEIPAARRSFGGWRQPREEFPRRLSAPPALYRRRESSIDPGMLAEVSLDLMDASIDRTPVTDIMDESMQLDETIPETPVHHFPGIIEPRDAFSPRAEEEFRNATRRFLEVKYNDEMYYPSQMFAAIPSRDRLDDEQLALDSFESSGMLDNLDISLADDSIPEPSIRRLSKRYSFGLTPPRPRPRRRYSGPAAIGLEKGPRPTNRYDIRQEAMELVEDDSALSDLANVSRARPRDVRFSFGMTPPRPRTRRRLSGSPRVNLERGRFSGPGPLPLADTSMLQHEWSGISDFIPPPPEEMFRTIGMPGRRASFGGATDQGKIYPGGRMSGPPELERAGGFDLFDLDARRPVTDVRYSFGMTPPRPRPRRRLSGSPGVNLERGRRSAVPLPLGDTSRPLLDITSPEFVTPPYEEMFRTVGMPSRRASFGGATSQGRIYPGGRMSGPPELERAGGFDLFDLDARRPVTDVRYSFGMTPPRPRPRRRLSGSPGVNLERGRRSAVPLPLGDTSRPLLDMSSFETPPYEQMFKTVGMPGRRASFGGATGQGRIYPGGRISGPPELERAGGFDLFDLDARRPVTDVRYSFGMTPPRPRPHRRLSGSPGVNLERGRRSAVPLPLSDTSRPLLDITSPEFVTPPYEEMFRTIGMPGRRASFGGATDQGRICPGGRMSGPPELERAGGFDLFDLDARRPVTDIRYSFGMTPPRPRPRRRLSGPPGVNLERGRRSSAVPLPLNDTSRPLLDMSSFETPPYENMFTTVGVPDRRASFGGATGQGRICPEGRMSGPPELEKAGGFDLFDLDARRPVTDVRYSFGMTPPRPRPRRRLSGPPDFNLERGRPSSLGPLPINDMTMSLFEEPSDFDSTVADEPEVCPAEPGAIAHVAKVSFINITSEGGEKQVSVLSEEAKRQSVPSRDSPEGVDFSLEGTSGERPGDVLLFDGPESKPWKIAIQFNPQDPAKSQESKECRDLKNIIRNIAGKPSAPSVRRTLKPSYIPRQRLSPIEEAGEAAYPFTPSPPASRPYDSLDDTEEFEKLERMVKLLEREITPSPSRSGGSPRRKLVFGPTPPDRSLNSTEEFERLERMIDEIETYAERTPSPGLMARQQLFKIPAPSRKPSEPPLSVFQRMSRRSYDQDMERIFTPAAAQRVITTAVSPIAGPLGACPPAPPARPAPGRTGIPLPTASLRPSGLLPAQVPAPLAVGPARAQARAQAAQARAAEEQAARAQAARAQAAQARAAQTQAATAQAARDQDAQTRAALGLRAGFRAGTVRLTPAPARRPSALPIPSRLQSASDLAVAPPRARTGCLNLRGTKMTSSTPMPKR